MAAAVFRPIPGTLASLSSGPNVARSWSSNGARPVSQRRSRVRDRPADSRQPRQRGDTFLRHDLPNGLRQAAHRDGRPAMGPAPELVRGLHVEQVGNFDQPLRELFVVESPTLDG